MIIMDHPKSDHFQNDIEFWLTKLDKKKSRY